MRAEVLWPFTLESCFTGFATSLGAPCFGSTEAEIALRNRPDSFEDAGRYTGDRVRHCILIAWAITAIMVGAR